MLRQRICTRWVEFSVYVRSFDILTPHSHQSNAEKAHKLALDFKMALEAYKKQVVDLQTSLSHAAKKDGEM